MNRKFAIGLIGLVLLAPSAASAWGYEGHEIIAEIARAFMTPVALARADAILATDHDTLTAPDFVSRATWADAYRGAGHRETAPWHFVDLELDGPDLKSACFNFPAIGAQASQGTPNDCLVAKLNQFTTELADPNTAPAERVLALKYVLHFVGDVHQPLHASDNHDHGGNCVQLSLGGVRSTNLHAYWDTGVLQSMGSDPAKIATDFIGKISPNQAKAWATGDASAWAMESFGIAKTVVYTVGSKPGCNSDGPLTLPPGYEQNASAVASVQMEKAGVRLAFVLNRALGV